jgi:hypothetical protein
VFASQINFEYEVFVVDNASKDDSVEVLKKAYPQVSVISAKKNFGFAGGNNIALRQAQGKYVLLLNSDSEVQSNTLETSVKYMEEHPQVGAMSCKVLLPDGSLDKACRRKFPNPWNSFLRLFGLRKFSNYNFSNNENLETEVDAVAGAFMLVRKEVIDKIGLLDEEFFMYGEDLDWCWRIKEAGYKIMYVPETFITHFKYGSSRLVPFKMIRAAHNAMKIFYRKHYAKKYDWLFNQFVYLGINLRMLLVLVINLFRNKKSVH